MWASARLSFCQSACHLWCLFPALYIQTGFDSWKLLPKDQNNLKVTSFSSRPLFQVYSIAIHYCYLNHGLPRTSQIQVFIVDQSTTLQDYLLPVVVCSGNLRRPLVFGSPWSPKDRSVTGSNETRMVGVVRGRHEEGRQGRQGRVRYERTETSREV
jgi:hypothetical protein